jgi:hypothetical protein
MYWNAGDLGESELYKIVGTTEADGTSFRNLGDGATRYGASKGLSVETREHLTADDLRKYLKEGTPVILNIQAWRAPESAHIPWRDTWEEGHFVVLVAMDSAFVYFMDPSAAAGYGYFPLGELDDRWHDYDVVNGQKVVSDHVGIAIRGKKALKTNPGPLVRVN